MILGREKTKDFSKTNTLYEYASNKGLSSIQVDEALYRITRGLSVPETTLKVIVEYITQYIMLSNLHQL